MSDRFPLLYDSEIMVVGGGPAGVAAAVSAARNGGRVVLGERYGFLGGMATAGLVNPFMTFSAGGKQIIHGVFQELLERLEELGGWGGEERDWSFDPEVMKHACEGLCQEAGVELAYHCLVCGAEARNGRIEGVVLANKSGIFQGRARVFVDCSGDGDLAAYAGAQFEKGRGEDGLCQPMTLNFRMTNVDEGRMPSWGEAEAIFRRAKAEGRLTNPRENLMYFLTPRKGEVHFNTTRIIGLDSSDPRQLSEAEVEGRRQVREMVDFVRREVPGFERAELLYSGVQVGVRESRRILGQYVMTREDVLEARKHPDGIARGSYPIDIHSPTGEGTTIVPLPEGESYDIPYGCLVPRGLENLLVAGRPISATHEAHGSTRIMPICFATGQAAGTAAAMCVGAGCSPRELDVQVLRERLMSQGANLGQI